jgi:hypothetical protein
VLRRQMVAGTHLCGWLISGPPTWWIERWTLWRLDMDPIRQSLRFSPWVNPMPRNTTSSKPRAAVSSSPRAPDKMELLYPLCARCGHDWHDGPSYDCPCTGLIRLPHGLSAAVRGDGLPRCTHHAPAALSPAPDARRLLPPRQPTPKLQVSEAWARLEGYVRDGAATPSGFPCGTGTGGVFCFPC